MRALVFAFLAAPACAFVSPAPARAASARSAGYVPDGMSAEQYAKLKDKEKKARETKNFGAGGARGFTSRSMTSFQYALERGEDDDSGRGDLDNSLPVSRVYSMCL